MKLKLKTDMPPEPVPEPPSFITYRRWIAARGIPYASLPLPVSLITEELAFGILSLPVNDDSRDWLEARVQLFVSDDARLYPEVAIEYLLDRKTAKRAALN